MPKRESDYPWKNQRSPPLISPGDADRRQRRKTLVDGAARKLNSVAESLENIQHFRLRPARTKTRLEVIFAFLSGLFTFLVLGTVGVSLLYIYGQTYVRRPGPLPEDKIILIPAETEVPEILAKLKEESVIESDTLLNMVLLLEGKRNKLKAGEYLLRAHISLQDVIELLISGRVVLHSFTVPEGLTSDQVLQRLRDNDIFSGEIREPLREGSILPETYKFPRGAQRDQILQRMQAEQKRVVSEIWAKRSRQIPIKSPYELMILASIVEKETGKAEERQRVAAVFSNRIAKHMRLQSDPTIIYGIVGGKGTLGRALTRSDIEQATPYNTYVIDGLPPGPICNPGRAALEAVANPGHGKELYFVADGTGGHVFAETLEQHQRNVKRWREIELERKKKMEKSSEGDNPSDLGKENIQ